MINYFYQPKESKAKIIFFFKFYYHVEHDNEGEKWRKDNRTQNIEKINKVKGQEKVEIFN